MNEQAQLDMPPPPAADGGLQWIKPKDGYYVASACGRYSVCRLTVSQVVWYVAWRKPCTEIGHTTLPLEASDEERVAAIQAMKQLCADHSGAKREAA